MLRNQVSASKKGLSTSSFPFVVVVVVCSNLPVHGTIMTWNKNKPVADRIQDIFIFVQRPTTPAFRLCVRPERQSSLSGNST
jgi:hypothetical protein